MASEDARLKVGEAQLRKVGLPPRPFLYTIDQIGSMLDVDEQLIVNTLLHFEGRSIGLRERSKMTARNIAAENEPPEWRVSDREFVRWMRVKGFKYYDQGLLA